MASLVIYQRKRKQRVPRSLLLCRRPLRSWGEATVLLKGTHCAGVPLPAFPRCCYSLSAGPTPVLATCGCLWLWEKACKSELKGWDGETQARPGFKRQQEMNTFIGTHGKGDLNCLEGSHQVCWDWSSPWLTGLRGQLGDQVWTIWHTHSQPDSSSD